MRHNQRRIMLSKGAAKPAMDSALHLRKKSIRMLICIAVGVAYAAVSANAAVESYSVSYGSASAPLVVAADGSTDFPFPLAVPQFNPSLGTLTGVAITLSSTDIAGPEVFNFTGTYQAYAGAQASDLTVNITGPYSLETSAMLSAGPFSSVGSTVAPYPSSPVQAGNTTSISSDLTDVPSSDFASYIGSGMVSMYLDASVPSGSFSGSGVPGVFFGGFADSYGSIEIEYDFSAVPEPGTLAAGVAALGVGLFALTRRSLS